MELEYFNFTYYKKIIQSCPTTMRVMDYKQDKVGVLLRHDVDVSMDLAFKFYEFEKDLKIKSTYYILLTGDLYNPFSKRNRERLALMKKDGFEIGLHFDPMVYEKVDESELNEKFLKEIQILEDLLEDQVYSYSMHNPSIYGIFLENKNYINAYDPEIFSDENYLSDSIFSFRGKDPIAFLQKSNEKIIQFLSHPEIFFNGNKISYEFMLNKIMNSYREKIHDLLSVNSLYKKQFRNYVIGIDNIQ